MNHKRRLLCCTLLTIISLLALATDLLLCHKRNPVISTITPIVQQNAFLYTNEKTIKQRLIPVAQQKKLSQHFLSRYFSPWHKNMTKYQYHYAKNSAAYLLRVIHNQPGNGMNYHAHTTGWVNKITNNMQLAKFPSIQYRGVITHNTPMRTIPTNDPSYLDHHKAGEGYPFDRLQMSALWIGQPIEALHKSKDGAWLYVRTGSCFGWIAANDTASINKKKRDEFSHGPFVTITADNQPLYDEQSAFVEQSKIGQLFPIIGSKMIIPVANRHHQAVLTTSTSPEKLHMTFPLAATPENFAKLINETLGEPYGWGGFQKYRDCSLMLKHLYASFGIWLPRSAGEQAQYKPAINVTMLNNHYKDEFIRKNAQPFLTILGMKGHIVMYIGNHKGKPIIFNARWAVHTKDTFGNKGRAILGIAALTTLDFGKSLTFAASNLLVRTHTLSNVAESLT
jgi:hypothetical protein